MAFKFGQKGGQKKASNIVRLTSLFPLKAPKKGAVGGVQGEYFDRLVKLVEEAVDKGTGITFFYNKWAAGDPASLSAAVAEPYEGNSKKYGTGGGYKAQDEVDEQQYEEQVEEEGE